MIPIKILDETSPLESVILGTAESFGGTPTLEEAYDPKSKLHIIKGTYPNEKDLLFEMESFASVLNNYEVKVYRPEVIEDYNQIFSRDIGMVIDDRFIVPRILKNRKEEIRGIQYILEQIEEKNILKVDTHARLEGGDIMPWNGKIFAGYSKEEDFQEYVVSRTNEAGIEFLQNEFSDWEVVPFELNKSDDDPYENALHLDCCFQPVGKDMAILFPEGFKNKEDIDYLYNFFGKEKLIEITREEMFNMNSNIFSISHDVIVSEIGFTRLNAELRKRGFTVEEIPYSETSKMEGLLRCSTLPLRRKYD